LNDRCNDEQVIQPGLSCCPGSELQLSGYNPTQAWTTQCRCKQPPDCGAPPAPFPPVSPPQVPFPPSFPAAPPAEAPGPVGVQLDEDVLVGVLCGFVGLLALLLLLLVYVKCFRRRSDRYLEVARGANRLERGGTGAGVNKQQYQKHIEKEYRQREALRRTHSVVRGWTRSLCCCIPSSPHETLGETLNADKGIGRRMSNMAGVSGVMARIRRASGMEDVSSEGTEISDSVHISKGSKRGERLSIHGLDTLAINVQNSFVDNPLHPGKVVVVRDKHGNLQRIISSKEDDDVMSSWESSLQRLQTLEKVDMGDDIAHVPSAMGKLRLMKSFDSFKDYDPKDAFQAHANAVRKPLHGDDALARNLSSPKESAPLGSIRENPGLGVARSYNEDQGTRLSNSGSVGSGPASSGKWRNAFSGEEESISVRGLEEPNLLETQAPAAPPTAVPEPQAMQMGTSGQDLVMRPRSAHRARRSSASHGPKKRNSLTGSATSEEEPQQDDRGSGFASRLGGGQAGERVEYNPLQAGGKENGAASSRARPNKVGWIDQPLDELHPPSSPAPSAAQLNGRAYANEEEDTESHVIARPVLRESVDHAPASHSEPEEQLPAPLQRLKDKLDRKATEAASDEFAGGLRAKFTKPPVAPAAAYLSKAMGDFTLDDVCAMVGALGMDTAPFIEKGVDGSQLLELYEAFQSGDEDEDFARDLRTALASDMLLSSSQIELLRAELIQRFTSGGG